MSFQNLKVDELKELAEFYTVEVKPADEEHGPTKKELLAALAEEEVTKEDYDTFVAAKNAGTDKSKEEKLEEKRKEAEEKVEAAPEAEGEEEVEEIPEPEDKSDWVLVKMERKNASFETAGFRFSKAHPFSSVPPHVAKYLVQKVKGFRVALPDEVTDYYN
jgi:hypothetical protein